MRIKKSLAGDAGFNHCLPGAARRKRRQLRDDCHGLALKRRAAGKIARQRRCEGFRALDASAPSASGLSRVGLHELLDKI